MPEVWVNNCRIVASPSINPVYDGSISLMVVPRDIRPWSISTPIPKAVKTLVPEAMPKTVPVVLGSLFVISRYPNALLNTGVASLNTETTPENSSSKAERLDVDMFGDIKNWPKDFFGDEMGDLTAKTKAAMRRQAEGC